MSVSDRCDAMKKAPRLPLVFMALLALGGAALAEGEEGTPEAPASHTGTGGLFAGRARFWSLGAATWSSFTVPWLIGTLQGAVSFFPHATLELGCDLGLVHGYREFPDMDYVSLYPFGHINGLVPLENWGLWYGGLGGGVMLAFYTLDGNPQNYTVPALDLTTGLYLGKTRHYLTISYTLRTDFEEVNHKLSLGYSYRFSGPAGTGGEAQDDREEDAFLRGINR
jgi:hypothetical protein